MSDSYRGYKGGAFQIDELGIAHSNSVLSDRKLFGMSGAKGVGSSVLGWIEAFCQVY